MLWYHCSLNLFNSMLNNLFYVIYDLAGSGFYGGACHLFWDILVLRIQVVLGLLAYAYNYVLYVIFGYSNNHVILVLLLLLLRFSQPRLIFPYWYYMLDFLGILSSSGSTCYCQRLYSYAFLLLSCYSYHHFIAQAEAKILRGPHENLESYLEAIDLLRNNIRFLSSNKSFRSSDGALNHANDLLAKAISKLEEEFKKRLSSYRFVLTCLLMCLVLFEGFYNNHFFCSYDIDLSHLLNRNLTFTVFLFLKSTTIVMRVVVSNVRRR